MIASGKRGPRRRPPRQRRGHAGVLLLPALGAVAAVALLRVFGFHKDGRHADVVPVLQLFRRRQAKYYPSSKAIKMRSCLSCCVPHPFGQHLHVPRGIYGVDAPVASFVDVCAPCFEGGRLRPF